MESGRAPTLTNGQVVFDRYRLKALVGRGAIGVVWCAFDEELEADIALKFLSEEFLFDPAAVADFKRETRRGMALAHPHILRIYGFFQGGGHAAIAMEMIEGNTLAALQAAHRPPCFEVAEIAEWTRQLCGALHYAHHEAQLVHRDLKPGNLLVDDRGRLRVADFGIAAGITDARHRRTGSVEAPASSGTLAYMSVQQMLGQKPSPEHDIYSLGATLYDLLTGRPPFHSGDLSLQIRTVTPPPVAERRTENGFAGSPIPPEWEETIAACLAKDASRRPASAAEVAERLRLGQVALDSGARHLTGTVTRGSTPSNAPHPAPPTVLRPSGEPAAAAGLLSRDSAGTPPASERASGTSTRNWKLAAAVGLLAALIATVVVFRPTPPVAAPTKPALTAALVTAPAVDQNSIAVLAFRNLSGDKEREFFSDGLSEALADALGRVPGLRVAGSASAFSFKGKAISNPEIARQLGVAYLVEGAVRQEEKRVRVTAKLINAEGFQVWVSENLDREERGILALYDELAGLIAQRLSLQLGRSVATTAAVNPEAFELYLQGRQAWNRRNNQGFREAESYFNRALELDPKFARAHAALADVALFRLGSQYGRRNSPQLREIMARIDQALTLEPQLAEAYASRGLAYQMNWQLPDSIRELRRAIVLNPNYATAHQWLGKALFRDGRIAEGLPAFKLAAELDPLSPRILNNYAWALSIVGRHEEALALAERAVRVLPESRIVLQQKGPILASLHRDAEALAVVNQLGPGLKLEAGTLLAQLGQKERAEELLLSQRGGARFVAMAALGRVEESVAALQESEFGQVELEWLFFSPVCDSVRDDPRVAQFMARIGQADAFARLRAWRAAQPPAPGK